MQTIAIKSNFWFDSLPGEDCFLTRGGEARVYLKANDGTVIKLNDAIYYATWLEFLNSVVIHNLIFSNTCYELLGFIQQDDVFYACLSQPFIIADGGAEIDDIKYFLEYNEFKNTRRNDYIKERLGLILEDMHDENVIVNSQTLFFIDSVFYTTLPSPQDQV